MKRLSAIASLAVTPLIAGQALAATILVNVAGDPAVDMATGCSLRQAVLAANRNVVFGDCNSGEALPAIDEIRFDAALDGTRIVLTIAGAGEDAAETGDLDLTESVNIVGNGNVVPVLKDPASTTANTLIDGNGLDRVFDVHADIDVVMEQLAITGGFADDPLSGGGILARIFDSSLILRHVAVFSNRTASGDRSGGFFIHTGGGIYAGEDLTLENSAVYDNIAQASGDDSAAGGGVSVGTLGRLTISESVIAGNEATASTSARGGGIEHGTQGQLIIRDSIVSDNVASAEDEALGGGIKSWSDLSPAIIEHSEISRNEAIARGLDLAAGGGIHSRGPLTLSNSTVSGNRVRLLDDGGGAAGLAIGAGLYVREDAAVINNSTLTGNSAENFAAADTVSGGVQVSDPLSATATAELRISNTIIADASGDLDCRGGPIISGGYNLLGNKGGSQATCAVTAGPDDQLGAPGAAIDPLLAAPGMSSPDARRIQVGERSFRIDHYQLLDGSPAIDAGNPNMVAASSPPLCEEVDQRGFVRPADGGGGTGERCDIGAIERNASAPVSVVLAVEDSPDPVEVDREVTYTAVVRNDGPGDATGVIVSFALPAALSFQASEAGSGSCSNSGGNVECELGELAAGESVEASAVATALEAGSVDVTVTVTVNEPDAASDDNSVTVSTTVDAPSGGGGGDTTPGSSGSGGGSGGGSADPVLLVMLGCTLLFCRRSATATRIRRTRRFRRREQ